MLQNVLVQAIWLLPTLLSSVVFAMRTGDWLIAYTTAASLILSSFLAKRRSHQTSSAAPQVDFRRERVFLNGRRLPRSSKLWLPTWRKSVFDYITNLPQINQHKKNLQTAKQQRFAVAGGALKAWIGSCSKGDMVIDLVLDGPHLFVVGPTGSGKSQLLRLLLTSMTASNHPNRLKIMIADFKGSALTQALAIKNWIAGEIDDLEPDSHAGFWALLSSELENRERELKRRGIASFDRGLADAQQLLVVVDEVAAACKSSVKATEVLSAVAARGRSLGIVLVVANQGLGQVPRELLLNLRARIALAGTDQVELVQLGGAANKILIGSQGWVSARLIGQSIADRDFMFPLGVS